MNIQKVQIFVRRNPFERNARPRQKMQERSNQLRSSSRRKKQTARRKRCDSGFHCFAWLLHASLVSLSSFSFSKDTKDADARKKPRKPARKAQFTTVTSGGEELSAAQIAANEQMRKVLEEDCYSAIGSIVESGSEDEDAEYHGRGAARLDRSAILSAMRKRVWMERMSGSAVLSVQEDEEEEEDDVDDQASRSSRKAKTKKKHRKKIRPGDESLAGTDSDAGGDSVTASDMMSVEEPRPADTERDEGSIFGATAGASNATWVECDKCKKVRRNLCA